ncbi:hypothetical protein F5887DRAFT_1195887 [Amanita rubescens]|nr:hypothetical protein F5887DRAFT_1195887 [Amanita rubescens]
MSFLSPNLPHVQNIASTSFLSSSSNSPSSSASSTFFSSSSSATSNPLPSSFSSSHATTSSSLPSVATTVTTEQSFSSTSTSSTYAPTSTSLPSTFTAAPSTALVVATADTASVAGFTTPTASTNPSRDLSSSGFWSNKKTVTATFTIVGLVVCALIGGAIFILARQRKRDRELTAGEEFYDRHNSVAAVDAMREPSPAPSMAQEMTHAPIDVYVNRDVHFGSDYLQPTYSGLDYPQGVAYGQVDERTHSTDGDTSAYMPPQPSFVSVAHAPPVSYRQPRGRAPGTYQPSSIDSFYGGIQEK